MGRPRAHVSLNVFLNGRHVGMLRRASTGAIDFQYMSDWLGWSQTFPISLSLPLREDRYIGAPVVAVFDNLLPDSDLIRRHVAERVGAEGIDAFSLLAALGRDCVGALQLLPEGEEPGPVGSTDGKPLNENDIAEIIRNLAVVPLGLSKADDFRISIAGAQEKTALLFKDGRWFKPIATTATTHILKPPIGRLSNGIDVSDSVENEYFCLKLLESWGIPVAKAEMGEFGGQRTLVVERFDRLWTRDGRLLRLPQEDCCQALSVPPTRKYQADGGPGIEDLVHLLKGSDTAEADVATLMKANVAFWLLGATDGHAKNFSIFLAPGGRYRMTPLYDVLSAQPSLDTRRISRRSFKLAMSAGYGRHYVIDHIVPRHMFETAEMSGVGASIVQSILRDFADTIVRKTEETVASLSADVPSRLVASITDGLAKRVQLIERALANA